MRIGLSHGSGGKEMTELISRFGFFQGDWKNTRNDSATLDLGDKQLIFTTDSFVVDPIFFPGGDIGHLAFCGTVNDLAVMGARPLGLSLGLVIEEGFSQNELDRIIGSIRKLSDDTGIPVATGDTKVMENGKIDRIVVNTSGVAVIDKDSLLTKDVFVGDKVIVSGGIGEHAVAILSKRFDYEAAVVSDSKPLVEEIESVKPMIKVAKDPTRGGLSAALNEICGCHKVGMLLDEGSIPAKPEVRKVAEMLGISLYELACEGRFVCIVSPGNAKRAVEGLQRFNPDARVIGEVTDDDKVVMQTIIGKRILPCPSGRIVPRIC
ncbi:MAG: hydrogenase expression/formation protein HypE [archaeon]